MNPSNFIFSSNVMLAKMSAAVMPGLQDAACGGAAFTSRFVIIVFISPAFIREYTSSVITVDLCIRVWDIAFICSGVEAFFTQ